LDVALEPILALVASASWKVWQQVQKPAIMGMMMNEAGVGLAAASSSH
jgi:hypothetical protein